MIILMILIFVVDIYGKCFANLVVIVVCMVAFLASMLASVCFEASFIFAVCYSFQEKACFKTLSTWPWLCMSKPFTNLH